MHQPVGVLDELARVPTEYVEPHCLLARTEVLRRIGPFDEELLAGREHSSLSLQVRAAGGEVWLEPAVVVRYAWPKRNTIGDYRLYLPRWSDEWGERSYRRFNETWQITDTTIDEVFRHGHRDRRMGGSFPRGSGLVVRVRRLGYHARRVADRVVTPLAVGACDRRRARRLPAQVLHAASWERTGGTDASAREPSRRSS